MYNTPSREGNTSIYIYIEITKITTNHKAHGMDAYIDGPT